ncbi:MAG: SusC/RagA family TonB-linked outer membrane protein [Bacteroidaceae bacterium]|nr:SusC/RagA family TonB-linked outer membrane protein [Bacteroidaceae bacterium]
MKRLILLLSVLLAALVSRAQEPTYSVTYEDASIGAVMRDITRRTGYEFVHQKGVTDGAPPITAILRDATLSQLLNRTLVAQCGLEYEIVQKTIVLRLAPSGHRFVKRSVTGMVIDDESGPLPGASVRLRGTNEGVVTDLDGQFSIMVEGTDPVLDISYMGMKPVSVKVSPRNNRLIAVKMQPNENLMEEVLVTGYQNIKRENATGSYQLISGKALDQRYVADVASNLEGRVPGLVGYDNGLTDGGESALVIRGTGSFNARTSPLIVVDGLPVEGGLASVNPYNIENITILKDAAAASIYGARASNGVIVITTKRAKTDRLDVDFSADLTVSEHNDYGYMHWADAGQLVELERKNFQFVKYNPNQSAFRNLESYYTRNPQALSPIVRLLMANHVGEMTPEQLEAQLSALARNDYRREWQDAWERTHVTHQYNLALRNRGKYVNSSIVANYRGDNLGVKREHSNTLTFSYRGDIDVARWLSLEFGANLINERSKQHVASEWNGINSFAPYRSMYNADGTLSDMEAAVYLLEPSLSNTTLGLKSESYNLRNELGRNFSRGRQTNIRSFVHAKARLLEGWTATGMFQYEDIFSKTDAYEEAESYDMRHLYNLYTSPDGTHLLPDGGLLRSTVGEGAYYTFRAQTDYSRTFRERHALEVLAGFEYRQTNYKSNRSAQVGYDDASQTNTMGQMNFGLLKDRESSTSALGSFYSMVGAPGAELFGTSDVLHRFYSVYANGGYTYDHRYSLTASWRVDKADLFGADPKYRGRPLWSVGAAWNVENEAFMKDVKWVDALKLRASYGLTGNIAQDFSSYLTATVGVNEMTSARVATLDTPPNDQLRWEKTASLNVGADFALWHGRLTGALDVYRKQGTDLLTTTDLDPTTGWTSLTINNGELRNTGVELQLNGEILRARSREALGISLGASVAYNKNKITAVNHEATSGAEALATYTLHQGYPAHSLFSYDFAGMQTQSGIQYFGWRGHDGTVHYTDINTEEFTPDDVVYSGSLDPKVSASLTPELTWRGFTLTAMLAYYGGHVMRARFEDWTSDGSQYGYNSLAELDAVPAAYLRYWNDESGQIPANGYPGSTNVVGSPQYCSANVVSADYMKLRTLVLGYDFPTTLCRRISLQALRLRLQVNNLCTWTRNSLGVDPEANNPVSGTTLLPTPRSYTMSLYANF